jgi:hypothetical protein
LATPLDLPPPVESSLIIPEPLFRPNWQRGILSAVLATEGQDGPPDIEKIVEHLVQGRIVHTIQRKPWPTLRRGVQLLIDQSEALTPFFADQTLLQHVIMQVAGTEKTEILHFSALPDRAGAGLEFEWQPYRPPLAGTPIVLLTDLGIGRPPGIGEWATTAEWLLFAQHIRRAGCPLLAVLPYARDRCPPALRRAIRIIPWDRHTTAGLARYLAKKS